MTMSNAIHSSSRLQQGSTLLVAVVILLLASLMALMAMNVGVFEQRSSGNDLRAKVVNQVAEAGLAQGFEYLFRANPALLDNAGSWQLCDSADTTFPCGAVDASVRGTMYRLAAGAGDYDATGSVLPSALTQHMLKVPATLPQMGGFNVDYGVAPVLCRVPLPVSGTSISCATDMNNLSDRRVVTFVSVAQIDGDAGRTTLTQTVARSSLLAQPGGVPTIIASGTVVPPGNGDVVAMPDAAGPGLDVAVWSRLDVDTTVGSFATCTRQDFLSSGEVSMIDAGWVSDRTCDKCSCGMAKKAAGYTEGWDILDKDSNDPSGINKDVVPAEFPCDLFEYAFNVKAWKDGADPLDDGNTPLTGDNDGFCESRMPMVEFAAPDGNKYQMYPDEAYLYQYAGKIKPASGNEKYVRAEQLFTGTLGASDSGMVWCQTDCLPNNGTVGSVAAPVAVIADPGTNTPYHAKLFGLLFYRSNGAGPLDPATGGNAGMKFNAQSAVYGSVVIQGQVQTGSGGGLLYGDADVLKNLNSLQSMARYDTLRGGWTDAYSY
jgi:hypothetical protein